MSKTARKPSEARKDAINITEKLDTNRLRFFVVKSELEIMSSSSEVLDIDSNLVTCNNAMYTVPISYETTGSYDKTITQCMHCRYSRRWAQFWYIEHPTISGKFDEIQLRQFFAGGLSTDIIIIIIIIWHATSVRSSACCQ